MSSKYKICIYMKNREKPIILTDVINKDNTYKDTVDFFGNSLDGKSKTVVLDFINDNVVLNIKDIDSVVISKPNLDDVDLISSDMEDEEVVNLSDDESINTEDEEDVVQVVE